MQIAFAIHEKCMQCQSHLVPADLRHDARKDGQACVIEHELLCGRDERLGLRARCAAPRALLGLCPLKAAQEVHQRRLRVAGRRALDNTRHDQAVQGLGVEQRGAVLAHRREVLHRTTTTRRRRVRSARQGQAGRSMQGVGRACGSIIAHVIRPDVTCLGNV